MVARQTWETASLVPQIVIASLKVFFYRDLCEESDTFSAPANAICQRLGTELFQAYLHHTRLQDEEYTKDFNKVLLILFL